MVRRLTTNQEIACSNPAVVTEYFFLIFFFTPVLFANRIIPLVPKIISYARYDLYGNGTVQLWLHVQSTNSGVIWWLLQISSYEIARPSLGRGTDKGLGKREPLWLEKEDEKATVWIL